MSVCVIFFFHSISFTNTLHGIHVVQVYAILAKKNYVIRHFSLFCLLYVEWLSELCMCECVRNFLFDVVFLKPLSTTTPTNCAFSNAMHITQEAKTIGQCTKRRVKKTKNRKIIACWWLLSLFLSFTRALTAHVSIPSDLHFYSPSITIYVYYYIRMYPLPERLVFTFCSFLHCIE